MFNKQSQIGLMVLLGMISVTLVSAGNSGGPPSLYLNVGHSTGIRSAAFSPDGATIATGGQDGMVRLWDTNTGQLKAILHKDNRWIKGFAQSHDGKILAVSDNDQIELWDRTAGRLISTWKVKMSFISGLEFSPDDRTLAIWGGTTKTERGKRFTFGEVQLWSIAAGKCRARFSGTYATLSALKFSPDSKTVATSGGGRKLVNGKDVNYYQALLWEADTGRVKATLEELQEHRPELAFSSDGSLLATSGSAYTVKLWDVASGQLKTTLRVHETPIFALAFSPDGKLLVMASITTVILWDVTNSQQKKTLTDHTSILSGLAFSPDGKFLVTNSHENAAKLWEVESGQLKATLQVPDGYQRLLAFSPNSRLLAMTSGYEDPTVRLWDVTSGQVKVVLQGYPGGMTWQTALSPDGKLLAAVHSDKTVRLWDTQTGKHYLTLQGHTQPVRPVVFSPDGSMLATGSIDRTAMLWDVNSGKLKMTIQGHKGNVHNIVFSPDKTTLATSDYRTVRLWNLTTGQMKVEMKANTVCISSVVFSPDGKTVITTGLDKMAKVWDVASGQLKATLQGSEGYLNTVALSPDGLTLATGGSVETIEEAGVGSFGEVRLWNLATKQKKVTLKPLESAVWNMIFSPDGAILAAVCGSKVYFWDSRNGKMKKILTAKVKTLSGLAFSRDSQVFAAYGFDGSRTVFWEVATGKELPFTSKIPLADFPVKFTKPLHQEGTSISFLDFKDGHVRAILTSLPSIPEAGTTQTDRPSTEWIVTTPEGYFDCSANAATFIRWKVGDTLYPAEKYMKLLQRPDLVRKALAGEKIKPPKF